MAAGRDQTCMQPLNLQSAAHVFPTAIKGPVPPDLNQQFSKEEIEQNFKVTRTMLLLV